MRLVLFQAVCLLADAIVLAGVARRVPRDTAVVAAACTLVLPLFAAGFVFPGDMLPFACLRLAAYVIWPFGRTTTWRRSAGIWSAIGNVVWVIFFGWWLALGHLVTGLLLMVTIIGIPFGVACWKMIPLSLTPLGREIVPISAVDRDPYGLPT